MANPTLEGPVEAQQATASADPIAITRDELKVRLGRGGDFKLVETLPPEQFRDGHAGRHQHASRSSVNARPNIAAGQTDRAHHLLCESDVSRVSGCCRELIKLGYTNVRHYAGGKADWRFAGLPIERAK